MAKCKTFSDWLYQYVATPWYQGDQPISRSPIKQVAWRVWLETFPPDYYDPVGSLVSPDLHAFYTADWSPEIVDPSALEKEWKTADYFLAFFSLPNKRTRIDGQGDRRGVWEHLWRDFIGVYRKDAGLLHKLSFWVGIKPLTYVIFNSVKAILGSSINVGKLLTEYVARIVETFSLQAFVTLSGFQFNEETPPWRKNYIYKPLIVLAQIVMLACYYPARTIKLLSQALFSPIKSAREGWKAGTDLVGKAGKALGAILCGGSIVLSIVEVAFTGHAGVNIAGAVIVSKVPVIGPAILSAVKTAAHWTVATKVGEQVAKWSHKFFHTKSVTKTSTPLQKISGAVSSAYAVVGSAVKGLYYQYQADVNKQNAEKNASSNSTEFVQGAVDVEDVNLFTALRSVTFRLCNRKNEKGGQLGFNADPSFEDDELSEAPDSENEYLPEPVNMYLV